MQFEIQIKRLERHYCACCEGYDPISLLDLAHSLRVVTESINLLPKDSNYSKIMLPTWYFTKKIKGLMSKYGYIMALFPNPIKMRKMEFGAFGFVFGAPKEDEIKTYMDYMHNDHIRMVSPASWLQSDAICWKLPSDGKKRTISRERLIKRVSNYLGGSHPAHADKEKASDDDKMVSDLMIFNVAERPLPYLALMSIAQEILHLYRDNR